MERMDRIAKRITAGAAAEAEIVSLPGDEEIEVCIYKHMRTDSDLEGFIADVKREHDAFNVLIGNVVDAFVKSGIDAEPSIDSTEVYTSSEKPDLPIVIERSVWIEQGTSVDDIRNCLNGLNITFKEARA